MTPKKKPCDGCGNDRMIWKNHQGKRFCKQCWSAHSAASKPTIKANKSLPRPSQKRIAPRSKKRIKEEKEYSDKRKPFLINHPLCQAHLPGICTQHSADVHHMAGRIGSLYLDEEHWLAVCRSCHMWIETHPREAREMGFSKSKTNN